MKIEPVMLEGSFVRLEPLSPAHHAGLCEVGLEAEIWRWMPQLISTPDDMHAFIEVAIKAQSEGAALPFATVEKVSGKPVGSTRFFNFDRAHRRTEIGWTWIAPAWQRTAVNTEAKYLMLRHAFETWKCIRVEFKTDSLNERSRAAILRLGAKEEGIFRNHMIMPNGRVRHSVYYSITDSEWPDVKARLEAKLGAR
ncbi:MAG: GNAT family N-acetyltransferase [Terriglobia bacterium]